MAERVKDISDGAVRPKVLVVDDEQDILFILSFLMNKAGYDVRTAPNGKAALEAVREGGIELVLLDYMLPDITGLEVLQRIKDSNSDIEVIIITGHGTDRVKTDVMAAGATAYMIKPFINDHLLALAGDTIKARRQRLSSAN